MKKCFLVFLLFAAFVCNASYKDCSYEQFKTFVEDAGGYLHPTFNTGKNIDDKQEENKLFDEDYKSYIKAREALSRLSEIPPNQFWVYTMKASEENAFKDMRADMKGNIPNAFKSRTGLLGAIVLPEFFDKCGLEMGYRNHLIGFLWLKSSDTPLVSSFYLTPWFWYEGRKYLPQIWNDWYKCWKIESEREKPRSRILKELIDDIKTLSYHVAPYVSKAIKDGDKYLIKFYDGTEYTVENMKKTYTEWWETEKGYYVLPECEGLDSALKRIDGKDSAFSRQMIENMRLWTKIAKNYYANQPIQPDYWYYRLDEDYDYDDEKAEEKLYNALCPYKNSDVSEKQRN